tara:strand:- start:50 stop:430 length:381 start_codon:yes stop_codon:yes gene_type:complete
MKSYVDQWRTIRKGFSKLMEVNERIGEEADYKEQDVVNCEWSDPKAIQQLGWVSEETAQRWSEEWMDFLHKKFKSDYGYKGEESELEEWYDNYGSQEDVIHMVLTSRVLKNDFKQFWLNCISDVRY